MLTHDSRAGRAPRESAMTPNRCPPRAVPTHAAVVALQRTAGNRATVAMLQRQTRPNVSEITLPSTSAETIHAAIRLFAASATAQTREGRRVLAELRALHRAGELAHGAPEGGAIGHSTSDPFGPDVVVHADFELLVPRTALVLVHEAAHVLYEYGKLREEIIVREFELRFYSELSAGLVADGVQYRTQDDGYARQLRYMNRGELVDFVVQRYTADDDAFDPDWITANLDEWGGLDRRWRHTLGRYLRALIEDPESYAAAILTILENAVSRSEIRSDVVRIAGGHDAVVEALHTIAEAGTHAERVRAITEAMRSTEDAPAPRPPATKSPQWRPL